MDWKRLLTDLGELGMTQTEIAKAIGVSNVTLSYLMNGRQKDLTFNSGIRLVEFHKKRMKQAEINRKRLATQAAD